MRNFLRTKNVIVSAFLFALLLLFCSVPTEAKELYANPDTGFSIYYEDDGSFFDSTQQNKITEAMKPLTSYTNIAFVSLSSNPYHTAEKYAKNYVESKFSDTYGALFLLDADPASREIYIYCSRKTYKTITRSHCLSITDNIYSYASDNDDSNDGFCLCAVKAFEQMQTILDGGRIAQPMKYLSNLFFALALALLINFFIVRIVSRKHNPSRSQLLNGIYTNYKMDNAHVEFVNQTKQYSPQSSGSGGGGHSGGSSGHSGGGGGGGHHF